MEVERAKTQKKVQLPEAEPLSTQVSELSSIYFRSVPKRRVPEDVNRDLSPGSPRSPLPLLVKADIRLPEGKSPISRTALI